MTLEQFKRTRTWSSNIYQKLAVDVAEGTNPSGYIYADSFYINAGTDSQKAYYLVIGNREFESDDLSRLETILWHNFAREELK